MYEYSDEEIEVKGFINKEEILKYVKQEDIFELVFGFKPKEFDYVTSPFRVDTSPGCWFEYEMLGKMYFKDFAYGDRPLDCFDCVRIHFGLKNFYESLKFVFDHLIKGKKLEAQEVIVIREPKKKVLIFFEGRTFNSRDKLYWERYQITKNNLIEDKVFPVNKYILLNTKKGTVKKRVYENCYAYTDFEDSRKKLYFPYRKEFRFITNCKKNDIGGINSLPLFGRQLIITKSYKDWRVLKNQGKNVLWLQNEGMVPDDEILYKHLKGYEEIIYWFDNDETGILASNKLKEITNNILPNKARTVYLPPELNPRGISDPSDLIYLKGEKELKEFIKNEIR